MAIYEHICTNTDCNNAWEETYSINADPPKVCPKCNQETAKRMISMGGKGQVILVGQDLADKVKADAAAYKREVYSSERAYSNAVGEGVYEKLQTQIDKQKR